ncbi:unnamed protein product [Auanema sp. JU1783]|nr:unnamed protein product [Auanema sp. JU1783]
MDQIRPLIDRYAVATLMNFTSFILICISLFSENWLTVSINYIGIKKSYSAGICCNMAPLAGYLKVTLGFMFTIFFISIICLGIGCAVFFFKIKKPDEQKVPLLKRISALLNAVILACALFLLFFTGISFATNSSYKYFKALGGHYNLSTCYWLLIPIAVLNAISAYLSVNLREEFNRY